MEAHAVANIASIGAGVGVQGARLKAMPEPTAVSDWK
jgi:hypothetical protein